MPATPKVEMRSRIVVASLLAAALVAAHGCATSPSENSGESSSSEEVQGSPPEDPEPAELPEGPEVKLEAADREEESRGAEETEIEQGASPTRSSGERNYVPEAEVEKLRERGPGYVFQVVEVEPVERNGSFRGYRIVGATDRAERVMRPHLQVGDVVTAVNGVPIEKPDDYMAAWKKLDYRKVLTVEFQRDGESFDARWVVRERVESDQSERRRGRRR